MLIKIFKFIPYQSIELMVSKRKSFGEKKRIELTDFESTSINDFKDRFSKWRNKAIDLLTFSINLLFTISIALSGLIISNYDKSLFKDKYICGHISLTQVTLFTLTLSSTIGLIGLITRLHDFKLTAKIISTRRRIFELDNDIKYEAYEPSDKEFQQSKRDNLICWTKFLGRITWICFYIQLFLFIISIWVIVWNV
jgi:hypothetical protein